MKDLVSLLDRLLSPYAAMIGKDFVAYRNHACRVAIFHSLLHTRSEVQDPLTLAAAAAFHDLGIWSARTFDYIDPSVQLAADYLSAQSRIDLLDDVSAMIRSHHKVTPCCGEAVQSAEQFRRADWMDVSAGVINFGISRRAIAQVRARFPGAGFHKLLFKLSLKRVITHPWNPLPMLQW